MKRFLTTLLLAVQLSGCYAHSRAIFDQQCRLSCPGCRSRTEHFFSDNKCVCIAGQQYRDTHPDWKRTGCR